MNKITATILVASGLFACGLVSASGGEVVLDVGKAEKMEVRQSMIGYRDTLLFYVFTQEKVVVVLRVGNEDETFPVNGKVYLFAKDVTKEKLGEWINNQHSDGLFPDVAEPEKVVEIPKDVCLAKAFERIGESENQGPEAAVYEDYEVVIAGKDFVLENELKIAAFEDKVKVHVKKK